MPRHMISFCSLAIILSGLLSSASTAQAADLANPGDQVVATVGGRTIEMRDLRATAQRIMDQGKNPEEAKTAALEALIRRQLMAVEAEAIGLEQDDKRQRMWRKIDGDLLREALEEDLIKDLVVSEEELATYLEMTTREMVLREIIAPDSATAAHVMAEIRAGKDFAELARTYSIDPETNAAGGLRLPTNEVAIALGPQRFLLDHRAGDVVGPFHFRQLYYITRIEERRPVAREVWTADLLLPKIAQSKGMAALDDYLTEMKEKYHYTFNAPAARQIAAAVRMIMTEHDSLRALEAEKERRLTAAEIDFRPRDGGDVWGLSDSLRAEWLFRHDLGGRTVGLYVDRMAGVPPDWIRTNINPSKIEFYCEEFFKDDVFPIEAKLRGLDVKIDYERQRRNRYEQHLTEQFYRQEIFEKINPSIDTLRAYWQANLSLFPPPEMTVATAICFEEKEARDRARIRLDQGMTFEALALELESEGSDGVEVDPGRRFNKTNTLLGSRITTLPVGGITEADLEDGRHCIFHVDGREPGERSFTSSYENILDHYRYAHDGPVMDAVCEELKKRHEVVINEELVATLTLSD